MPAKRIVTETAAGGALEGGGGAKRRRQNLKSLVEALFVQMSL